MLHGWHDDDDNVVDVDVGSKIVQPIVNIYVEWVKSYETWTLHVLQQSISSTIKIYFFFFEKNVYNVVNQ